MTAMEAKIIEEAEAQDVNPELAVAIAKCESEFNQGIKNPNSTASGVFQFLRSTWNNTLARMGLPNLDVFDGYSNIKVGTWLLKKDGVRHWLESKPCWEKYA